MIGNIVFVIFLSISSIDSAVALYKTRHIRAENLKESAKILQNVLSSDSNNLQANYELSKVYSLLGDDAKTKEGKVLFYNKGVDYSKKAIKIDDNSEWAHLWYMANTGKLGQLKGILNAVNIIPEIKKEIEKILQINPNSVEGLDARAALYYELPGFLGGNLNKSMEDLNKAIAIDSNNTTILIDIGKVYIKKKDYKKAILYLQKVLDILNPTDEAGYVLSDKPNAIKLLNKYGPSR
jgi:tetratricopeptide (TPR) repeat protein